MSLADLVQYPGWVICGVIAVLVLAGCTKGVLGIGMPVVAIPLLNLLVDLPSAVGLMSVPMVVTNIPQAVAGDDPRQVIRELSGILLGAVAGIVVGVTLLTTLEPKVLKPALGGVLLVIVGTMLASPRLAVAPRIRSVADPIAGLVGGVLGGVAALPGPFVFVYIMGLGVGRDRFVQYSSMYLTVVSAILTVTLGGMGALTVSGAIISALAMLPIFCGMAAGANIRHHIPALVFRRIILVTIGVSGIEMLASVFTR